VVCSLQPVLVTTGRIEYVYLCCGYFFSNAVVQTKTHDAVGLSEEVVQPSCSSSSSNTTAMESSRDSGEPRSSVYHKVFQSKMSASGALPTLNSFYCSEPVNHKSLRKLAVKNVVGFEPLLAIELVEGDCDYTYHVPLPNVATATLEVKLKNGCFTIKAERSHWQAVSVQGQTYKTERVYGGVEKSIEIPADADEGSVQASFKHNILIVKFMKTQSGGRSVHLMNKPADKGIVTWREGNQDAMSHFNFNIG
jgi:HSP20 family molecular chaperone IbpA